MNLKLLFSFAISVMILVLSCYPSVCSQEKKDSTKQAPIESGQVADTTKVDTVSFSKEVHPFLKKRCVGCHYAGNEFNESELSMESYELLMKGGVDGPPIIPGKADSSLIIKKLRPNPPIGEQMPKMSKEKLTEEEIKLIADWINQGAKKN